MCEWRHYIKLIVVESLFCYIIFLNQAGIGGIMADEDITSLGLDNIEELIRYFGIDSLKDEELTLKGVRRKIADKFDHNVDVLSYYIQPDSSFTQIHDAQALDDNDKMKALEVVKAFSVVVKENQLLEIDGSEESDKEFCKNALSVYKGNIETVKGLILKVKDAYNSKHRKTIDINYLG